MEALGVRPSGRPLTGSVRLPGSKSITNRALLLAALAPGRSRLTGALKSDDTRYMAQALLALGVAVEEPDATGFQVTGDGALKAPAAPLFLGNAGTATRFLTACFRPWTPSAFEARRRAAVRPSASWAPEGWTAAVWRWMRACPASTSPPY